MTGIYRKLALMVVTTLVGIAASSPTCADLQVRLRDGRVFTIPVEPDEVESFSFRPGTGGKPRTDAEKPRPSDAGANVPGARARSATATPDAGNVLRVGPKRELKLPSEAAAKVRDGDIVEIDAGDYIGDVAVWTRQRLTLRGVGGGRAHLRADGRAAEGKAIWVIKGKDTRVENIEFSGAKVSDGNGAGIRLEAAGLTVLNCSFHDNEDGILAGDVGGDIVIENSQFVRNGTKSGQTHALYINRVDSLTVKGSLFQETVIGHHIKSRAARNFILYNRILDGDQGTASYAIDLSNGGRSVVLGNVIQQGPMNDNSTIIAFAMEGAKHDEQDLHVVNNTIVNDHHTGTFVHSRSATPAQIVNNILVGPGTVLRGPGMVVNNLFVARNGKGPVAGSEPIETRGNKTVSDARFVDARRYDYRLLPGSPAIGGGIDPGRIGDLSLVPEFQPSERGGVMRRRSAPLDLGAYGFSGPQ